MYALVLFASLLVIVTSGACLGSTVVCEGTSDDTSLFSRNLPASVLQHASKVGTQHASTADTLGAIQTLVNKDVSGEEKISDATKAAMSGISDEMDKIMGSAVAQHAEDEKEVEAAKQAVERCGNKTEQDLEGVANRMNAMNSKKATHKQCREAEQTLLETKISVCDAFHAFVKSPKPPACMTNFPTSTSAETLECSVAIENWSVEYNKNFREHQTKCDDSIQSIDDKRTECNNDQGKYESSTCEYSSKLSTACADQTTCREGALAARAETHSNVRIAAESRQGEYKAAITIKCLLGVLFAPEAEKKAKLSACNSLDTTPPFKMEYPDAPAEVACDVDPAASKPCSDQFVTTNYANYNFEKHSMYSGKTEKVTTQECAPCFSEDQSTSTVSKPKPMEALLHHFDFESESFEDVKANAEMQKIESAPLTFVAGAPITNGGAASKAMTIPGGHEGIRVTPKASITVDASEWSHSFWFAPQMDLPAARIDFAYGSWQDGSSHGCQCYTCFAILHADGKLCLNKVDTTKQLCATTEKFEKGRWYHIAFVRGASTISIHVNGKKENEMGIHMQSQPKGGSFTFVSRSAPAGQGYAVDDVGFWSKALDESELQAVYEHGISWAR